MKRTIVFLVVIWSYIYSPKLNEILKKRLNSLFSIWIKKAFKEIGQNPHIDRSIHLKGGQYISIGNQFIAGPRLRLEAWDKFLDKKYKPSISIGHNVCFNFDCHIGAIGQIIIGNNVLFGSRILVTDHLHGEINKQNLVKSPGERNLFYKGSVIIEDNCWIGEGVAILPNVKIGANSIVGANSVVNKSFPPNSIIAGVPAQLIKTL